MGEVVLLNDDPIEDTDHIAPDVLLEANKGQFTHVVLVGWNENEDVVIARSDGLMQSYFMLGQAMHEMMRGQEP